jgi:aminoglycoside phosphotransferase (APT) family kinase protein
VLRRKPPGQLLPSAHAVDREFRVMSALARTDVPVPKMYALCEDASVIGTAFYVMEYIEGRVLWDPRFRDDARRAHRALRRVESRDRGIARRRRRIGGLADFGKPGNYVERQVARWSRQYQAAAGERIESMDRLIEWLPRHVPASDEVAIVHGDYRLDNVIFHRREPRILAVLDWELSTLGHPCRISRTK